jgi:hypothetical protein
MAPKTCVVAVLIYEGFMFMYIYTTYIYERMFFVEYKHFLEA